MTRAMYNTERIDDIIILEYKQLYRDLLDLYIILAEFPFLYQTKQVCQMCQVFRNEVETSTSAKLATS